MDINPIVGSDIKLITGYSNSGFTINNKKFEGNIILSNKFVGGTEYIDVNDLKIENLLAIYQTLMNQDKITTDNKAIFLFGTGSRHIIISSNILKELKTYGITLESMSTSAACRTYNILVSEDRQVFALMLTNIISA